MSQMGSGQFFPEQPNHENRILDSLGGRCVPAETAKFCMKVLKYYHKIRCFLHLQVAF